jgi:UDP-N-acetylmuramoyl-tripeptide--D-alanyl-D-alanine ligase
MHLHELAQALNAEAVGADVTISAIVTDSRKIVPGCLFVALKGPRYDGHHFAAKALEQGAAAVMVAAGAQLAINSALVVDDTLQALGRLAAWHRARMPARIAAITGSNGKTTVKEMLAAILAVDTGTAGVLATEGNLNNDIGMPLTLLRLTPEHRFAAIEMGMNHPGEIAYLTQIARPDVALVNNALRAHLEGLGSVESIARAKGEIYAGLKEDGIAIVNADDAHAGLWRGLAGSHPVMSFGLSEQADVRIRSTAGALLLQTPVGPIEAELQVPGEHNRRNAAAAATLALALGVDAAIDDSYNANPDSVRAAIDVLAQARGRRILVLGDMGEVGNEGPAFHTEAGAYARAHGIHSLHAVGDATTEAVVAFGDGAHHYADHAAVAAALRPLLDADTTVLVKGSRFMHMERVAEALLNTSGRDTHAS